MGAGMSNMRVDDYEVLLADDKAKLGKGGFGIVWRGRHVPTGETVAVKRVDLDESTRDAREYVDKYVMNEVRLLQSIRHDNVVKLFHSKKMPGYLYMFLEICDKGSLDKFVKKHELSEIHKVSFMLDMSRALECLHSQSPVIVHRDLKPENLLISSSSSTLAGFVLKLTDFGLSRRAPPVSAAFTATPCGSPPWMAPEIRPGPDGYVRYHIPADIFSAGLICHSLIEHVNGEPLCALKVGVLGVGEWMSIQKLANLPVTIPVITKASDDAIKTTIKGIVLQMVHPEPQARCSIQQVLSTINMAYGSVATSYQEVPGEGGATSARRATAAGSAAAKQSVSADEGATTASRGPARTQSLVERFGAASLESQVEAVVEYDYEAKEEDELNITKGDIITNIHKLDGGWWEGTLNGKTGMFPDNFVKEIEKEKKKSKDLSSSIKRGSASGGAGGGHVAELPNKLSKEGLKVGGAGPPKRQDSKPSVDAMVEYDYEAEEEDELNITKGDIITNIHKLDGGWWEGTLNGKTGMFPDNFVKEIEKEKKKSKDLSSSIKRGSASGGAGGGHVAELPNKLSKEGLKVGGAGPPKRQDSKPSGSAAASTTEEAGIIKGATAAQDSTAAQDTTAPQGATPKKKAIGRTKTRQAKASTKAKPSTGNKKTKVTSGKTSEKSKAVGVAKSRATAASNEPAGTETLVERFGATSLDAQGTLRVRKLGHISLTVKDDANLAFGPTNFIVGYRNHPDFFYYKFHSGKFHLADQKPIPDGVEYDEYKQVSGQGDIYIHKTLGFEICQFNEEMQLIRTFTSPGEMISLLPGGKNAVVSNHASLRTQREGVSLSVAPVSNLHAPHYRLDNPDAGAYSGKNELHACGRQDGRIAVIAVREPWVDIFNATGRHVCRTGLPRGACKPGCSDTRVLVPLWCVPRICVLSWTGELMHILEPEQLALDSKDMGYAVSPVHEGHFSFGTVYHEDNVHTYQILE